EELSHQKDPERRHEVGEDQRAERVDEPEVTRDQEDRDHHDLEGDHQRREQDHEQHVAPEEAEARERVTSEATEDEVADDRRERDEERVQEEAAEWCGMNRIDVVLPMDPRGQDRRELARLARRLDRSEQLEAEAIYIIREVAAECENP